MQSNPLLWCTYTEHLMHDIRDLMHGFTVSQVTNDVVYICMCTVVFHHIVIVFVRNYHNMVKKYCIYAQCMCTILVFSNFYTMFHS